MLPITLKKPKPLISVAGKPFLYFLMKNLLSAGFDELGIVVGYKKELVDEFVKEYFPSEKVTLIEQKEQLGTAHAVMCAEKFVGSDDFTVVMSDNLYSVKDLRKFKVSDVYTYIAAYKHENPERYGVIEENNSIVTIKEKPQDVTRGAKINAGLYKFKPELFAILKRIKPSERNELELTDAINIMSSSKKIKIVNIEDFWLDLARPEDIYKISEFIELWGYNGN